MIELTHLPAMVVKGEGRRAGLKNVYNDRRRGSSGGMKLCMKEEGAAAS